MKIVIVQGAFLPVPPLMGGAVEKIWYRMGQEFAALGHEVVHLSCSHPGLPAREEQQGVYYRRIKGYDSPGSMLKLKLFDLIYSLRVKKQVPRDAAIIVSNTFWFPILAGSQTKKVVVDMQRMPKGQTKLYQKVARIRANSSAVSEAVQREAPQLKHLLKTIPNPLTFTPNRANLPPKHQKLLYTGRVHPEKGLPILLEAFSKLAASGFDWELDIVGPWQVNFGGGGAEYQADLRKKWPHPSIKWHGAIFEEDRLHAFYRDARLFIYPSVAEKGETFGLAPLEAMSWGCVPVVSNLSCFRDFIIPDQNGIIFDHRQSNPAAELTTLLQLLISDSLRIDQFSRQAAAVNETHSPRAIALQFLSDFEGIVAHSH